MLICIRIIFVFLFHNTKLGTAVLVSWRKQIWLKFFNLFLKTIINRSTSCINRPNFGQPIVSQIKDLKARRQRNLTTSALVGPSSFFDKQLHFSSSFADNCLDKFLDSLEDINNYLDKQLRSTETSQQVTNKKIQSNLNDVDTDSFSFQKVRKSRRFSTQPILFGERTREQQFEFNTLR